MNSDRFIKVPSLVIHPDSLILYSKLEYFENTFPNSRLNNLKGKRNNHHKILSIQATRKLEKCIKYLIYLAHEKKVYNSKSKSTFSYKVGFITLTLASQQIHTDKVITEQLLHQFLIEAKQKWKVSRYVWKAEYQRNGNIHYHILVDRYIPFQELRNCWNRIQEKLGYVSRAKHKNSNYSYNSTDIHSLYNVKDVTSYITKYMSKTNKNRVATAKRCESNICRYNYEELAALTNQSLFKVQSYDDGDSYFYKMNLKEQRKHLKSVSQGAKEFLTNNVNRFRIWGCSQDLSRNKGCADCIENGYYEEIEKLRKDKNVKVYDADYYTVIYFKNQFLSQSSYPNLFNAFQNYLSKNFINAAKQLVFEDFICV